MASTTSTLTPLSISLSSASSSSSSSSSKTRLQAAASAAQCVTVPTIPPSTAKTTAYGCAGAAAGRKISRNVAAMATGEASASAEVVNNVATTETPEIVIKIQQAWDKVEDKYAVSSLAVAGGVGLVACAGVISAIDKLPLIPGVLELVGIGYTGYFAYRNLLSKPSREALIQKIKSTYSDIIGTS